MDGPTPGFAPWGGLFQFLIQLPGAIAERFTWAKFIYSVLLAGIVVFLVLEIWRLWFDSRVYFGRFEVLGKGDEAVAFEKAFPLRIMQQHRSLTALLKGEAARRMKGPPGSAPEPPSAAKLPAASDTGAVATYGNTSSAFGGPVPVSSPQSGVTAPVADLGRETTFWPTEVPPIRNPESLLEEVELSVQGVNIKQLLTQLRQWISQPNEISGLVVASGDVVRATISWPRGPQGGQLMEIAGQRDENSAAFHIACSLIWAQAAEPGSNFAAVERQSFCDWAEAWALSQDLQAKSQRVFGLSAEDQKRIEDLRAFLGTLITHGGPYPEVYRLRADLVDLMPQEKRTTQDLEAQQSDRLQYAAFTNPQKFTLPPRALEAVVLAGARPAWRIVRGQVEGPISETWASVLDPLSRKRLEQAARGTGMLKVTRDRRLQLTASGFAIAKDRVLTANYALTPTAKVDGKLVPRDPMVFCFGESEAECEGDNAHPVEEIEYAGMMQDGQHLAILRISGHDVQRNPPLVVTNVPADAKDFVGRYVAVIGYPQNDLRAPREVMTAVFGGHLGALRAMPGRILEVSAATSANPIRVITSDASTMGGVGGGPLVDLATGQVLGLHHSGIWSPDGLKSGLSDVLSDAMSAKQEPAANQR